MVYCTCCTRSSVTDDNDFKCFIITWQVLPSRSLGTRSSLAAPTSPNYRRAWWSVCQTSGATPVRVMFIYCRFLINPIYFHRESLTNLISVTVEPAKLMVAHFSWISWVHLTHNFFFTIFMIFKTQSLCKFIKENPQNYVHTKLLITENPQIKITWWQFIKLKTLYFQGDIGKMLDSVRIKTDYVAEKPPLLTFTDILTICAVLKGSGIIRLVK